MNLQFLAKTSTEEDKFCQFFYYIFHARKIKTHKFFEKLKFHQKDYFEKKAIQIKKSRTLLQVENHSYFFFYAPTMMLLIGMWMSLTKKPMKPMIAKPIAVATAILLNSCLSGLVQRLRRRIESLVKARAGSRTSLIVSNIFKGL